jgi:5-methyltetrahydrofolate--homocysteine methyltransferase
MEQTIALLHEKAPWCRVIVGGAVLTQDYADRIGADAYAQDAMACVRIAEEIEAQTSGKDPS